MLLSSTEATLASPVLFFLRAMWFPLFSASYASYTEAISSGQQEPLRFKIAEGVLLVQVRRHVRT
jgi:hypothetical protein